LLDLIIKVFKKAKLDKQQKMLLSLRFILRHIVLKYMIVVMRAPKRKQFPTHSNTSSKISSHIMGLRNK